MAEVTLKSLREKTQENYQDVLIRAEDGGDVLAVLRHPLRLTDEEREALSSMEEANFEKAPLAELRKMVLMLVEDDEVGKALDEMVGDDLPVYLELFSVYSEQVDLEKASPSRK